MFIIKKLFMPCGQGDNVINRLSIFKLLKKMAELGDSDDSGKDGFSK